MRGLEELKDKVLKAYRKCYDKTVAFTICKCSKEEKIALLQDEDFTLVLGAEKSQIYSNDIEVYDNLIQACKIGDFEDIKEEIKNFLRERCKEIVSEQKDKLSTEEAKNELKTKTKRYECFVKGMEGISSLNNAQVLLKALEKRQELLFNQMNQNQDDDKAMNITFYKLERKDYEGNKQIEIQRGGGKVKENFGKEEQDSMLARQKEKIQRDLEKQQG